MSIEPRPEELLDVITGDAASLEKANVAQALYRLEQTVQANTGDLRARIEALEETIAAVQSRRRIAVLHVADIHIRGFEYPERSLVVLDGVDEAPAIESSDVAKSGFAVPDAGRLPEQSTRTDRVIHSWPRVVQLAGLAAAIVFAVLAAGHVVAPAYGLAAASVGLAVFFFGNFAAHQIRTPNWLVGPVVSGLATFGCLGIAVAVILNHVLGD